MALSVLAATLRSQLEAEAVLGLIGPRTMVRIDEATFSTVWPFMHAGGQLHAHKR